MTLAQLCRFIGVQRRLGGVGFGDFVAALLGFHDEMLGPVEVDKPLRLRCAVQKGDGTFKPIVVILGVSRDGLWRINAQKLRQFQGKLVEIGALTAARPNPSRNKRITIQNRTTI